MDPAVQKQIKIKTGIVKRLAKEHAYYKADVEKQIEKIAKLKESIQNDDDAYAVKKAEEVLQESRGMIGDAGRRCTAAIQELKTLIGDSSLEDCQPLTDAREQLAAVEATFAV